MIETAFIFIILFVSIFIELVIGKLGISVPLLACCIFYIAIIYSFKVSFILSLLSGIILDAMFGRSFFITPFILVFISIFASYWLRKGDVRLVHVQLIPGFIISFLYYFPLLFINYFAFESGFLLFIINIAYLILGIVFGGILLPFIVLFLDFYSKKLGLQIYVKSQKKLFERT